jgi:hypothetical protein
LAKEVLLLLWGESSKTEERTRHRVRDAQGLYFGEPCYLLSRASSDVKDATTDITQPQETTAPLRFRLRHRSARLQRVREHTERVLANPEGVRPLLSLYGPKATQRLFALIFPLLSANAISRRLPLQNAH